MPGYYLGIQGHARTCIKTRVLDTAGWNRLAPICPLPIWTMPLLKQWPACLTRCWLILHLPLRIQQLAGLRAGESRDTDGAPDSFHGSQMMRDFLELGLLEFPSSCVHRYCVCILTRRGIYGEIWPEHKGNPEGGARGISRGLRLYFTLYHGLAIYTEVTFVSVTLVEAGPSGSRPAVV